MKTTKKIAFLGTMITLPLIASNVVIGTHNEKQKTNIKNNKRA